VSQVLDLARLSAGLRRVERRWFDVDRAARRAVRRCASGDRAGVTLGYDSNPGSRAVRRRGPDQVLVNLLANGVRFRRPGDGHPAAARRRVGHRAAGGGHGGDAADKLGLVFERYRQAHTGHGGSGLGLAIVRGLVEARRAGDGRVRERGTRFSVFLPRKAADAASRAPALRHEPPRPRSRSPAAGGLRHARQPRPNPPRPSSAPHQMAAGHSWPLALCDEFLKASRQSGGPGVGTRTVVSS
jgi:hypothetical protein